MSLASGLTRIGGSVRYCLISTNARSHSSFHSARLAPQSSEKGFRTVREPGNKTPKNGQPIGQLLDPFLGAGGRSLQDGLKLRRISFYAPLSYHKAKESADADPEGTF